MLKILSKISRRIPRRFLSEFTALEVVEKNRFSSSRLCRNDKIGFLRQSPTGFTLVEIAVAASLLGMTALAVMSVFASGIKTYYKLRDYAGVETDVLISLDKLERDLKNARTISGISFCGEPKRIEFPLVLDNPSAEKIPGDCLCKVSYYYDDYKKNLVRTKENYRRVVSELGPEEDDIERLAAITGIEFEYYYYNKETEAYEWKQSWLYISGGKEKEKSAEDEMFAPPLGVKIKLFYKSNEKDAVLNRFVFLPLSVSARLSELKKEAAQKKESEGGDEPDGSSE